MQKRIPLGVAGLALLLSLVTAPGAHATPDQSAIDLPGENPGFDPGGSVGEGGGGLGGETGSTGGGTPAPTVPPFNPPFRPLVFDPNLTLYAEMTDHRSGQSCGQVPHVYLAFSNDVTPGTPLYAAGVVVAGSRINFGFYTPMGQLVMTHLTQPAHSNCVVYHEPEVVNTAALAPGYYFVYASYWTLSTTGGTYETSYGAPVGKRGAYVTVIRIQ
jgi:hypothetical protein